MEQAIVVKSLTQRGDNEKLRAPDSGVLEDQ
jgi:hypothetical protein